MIELLVACVQVHSLLNFVIPTQKQARHLPTIDSIREDFQNYMTDVLLGGCCCRPCQEILSVCLNDIVAMVAMISGSSILEELTAAVIDFLETLTL